MNHNDTALAFTDDKTHGLRFRGRDMESRANIAAMYGQYPEYRLHASRIHEDIREAVEAVRRGESVILDSAECGPVLISPDYLRYVTSILENVVKRKEGR